MKKVFNLSKIILSLFLVVCAITVVGCKSNDAGTTTEIRVKSTLTNQQVLTKLNSVADYYATNNHKTTADFNGEQLNILYTAEVNKNATSNNIYTILTSSMSPVFVAGDKVVIEPKTSYNVGDIIKFDISETRSLPTVHRIIGIKDGTYICHGDNVQYQYSTNRSWQEEVAAIADKSLEDIKNEASALYQYVSLQDIEGVASDYMSYKSLITANENSQIETVLVENKDKYTVVDNQKTNHQFMETAPLNYALHGTTDNYMVDTFIATISEQSAPQILVEQVKDKNLYYVTALISKEDVGLGSETVYVVINFDDEKILSIEKLTIQNEGTMIETKQSVKFVVDYNVTSQDLANFDKIA